MHQLIDHIRSAKLLWLLVFTPMPLIAHAVLPGAGMLHFALSILAIVPLAALLSYATESVAVRTGDAAGGLLNATLGNLTELVIAFAALRAGDYALVKAALAGAIVTNLLFMTGMSLFIGGLRHHVQRFNIANARIEIGMLFMAVVGLTVPSAVVASGLTDVPAGLSLGVAVLLIGSYALALLFTLVTHSEVFGATEAHEEDASLAPLGVAIGVLVATTVVIALVSEVFVSSLDDAAEGLGLPSVFVGFVVVAIVGAAGEMLAAFAAASKNRLDLSIGIAFGSAAQIAMFVAPVLVVLSHFFGPEPMGLDFRVGVVVLIFLSVLTSSLVAQGGRSAWYVGVQLLATYAIFAWTFYVLPETPAFGG